MLQFQEIPFLTSISMKNSYCMYSIGIQGLLYIVYTNAGRQRKEPRLLQGAFMLRIRPILRFTFSRLCSHALTRIFFLFSSLLFSSIVFVSSTHTHSVVRFFLFGFIVRNLVVATFINRLYSIHESVVSSLFTFICSGSVLFQVEIVSGF